MLKLYVLDKAIVVLLSVFLIRILTILSKTERNLRNIFTFLTNSKK
jgi:hypothetical protein